MARQTDQLVKNYWRRGPDKIGGLSPWALRPSLSLAPIPSRVSAKSDLSKWLRINSEKGLNTLESEPFESYVLPKNSNSITYGIGVLFSHQDLCCRTLDSSSSRFHRDSSEKTRIFILLALLTIRFSLSTFPIHGNRRNWNPTRPPGCEDC